MSREVNLIGGFYKDNSLTFSAQDTVNWLPVPAEAEGARSPIKLRGLPGLKALGENVVIPQSDWISTVSGQPFAYLSTNGLLLPGDIVGTPFVSTGNAAIDLVSYNGVTYALSSNIVSRSFDKGATWQEIGPVGISNVIEIAADNDTVYAISNVSNKCFKSSGSSFSTSTTTFDGAAAAIAADASHVAVVAGSGIWLSSDKGQNFTKVYTFSEFSVVYGVDVDAGVVIVAGSQNSGGLTIYRHVIGGSTTEQNISVSITLSLADQRIVTSLGDGVFFIAICDTNTNTGSQFFRSINTGQTWGEIVIPGISPTLIRAVGASSSVVAISYLQIPFTNGFYVTSQNSAASFSAPVEVVGDIRALTPTKPAKE